MLVYIKDLYYGCNVLYDNQLYTVNSNIDGILHLLQYNLAIRPVAGRSLERLQLSTIILVPTKI